MRSNEKQTKEKIRRKDIRRDAEFCSILTKELDMEQAPDSYGKAMKRIYAELPRDMPVRRYPFRSALRSLAVVAALLFVFGLSLVGANRVYPQLTESLPGLGMVFKHVNGTVEDGTPNLPPVVQVVPVNTGPHKIPVFTPVQAEDPDGNGELTVENAWTDGKEVYLGVSLNVSARVLSSEELPETILFYHAIETEYDPDMLAEVQINGSSIPHAVLPLQFYGTNRLASASTYHYTGVWVLQVPEESKVGESLDIKMNLSHAWGSLTEQDSLDIYLPLDLQFSFGVEVDKNFETLVEKAEPDNRYQLSDVRVTPGSFTAQVEVPYMWYYGFSLLPGTDYFGFPDPATPYGMYAILSDEDGTVLWEYPLYDSSEYDPNTQMYLPIELLAQFSPQDREKLVLAFYQFDPNDLLLWAEKSPLTPEDIVNPVTAEFTIDLVEGTAAPSENYRKSGGIKLDSTRPLTGYNHPDFDSNLLYVQGVENGWRGRGPLVEIVLMNYSYTQAPAAWALECLTNGEVVQTAYGCAVEDESQYDLYSEELERWVYTSGGGYFWREETGQVNYEGNVYLHLFFLVDYPEEAGGPIDQMRLVDTETGEILIENVEDAYQENLIAVLTAQPYR